MTGSITGRHSGPPAYATSSRAGFVATVLYLLFEYGRPQDFYPQIGALRPGLILTVLLAVLLIVNGRRTVSAASPQTTRMILLLLLLALHVPFAFNTGRALIVAQSFLSYSIVFLAIVTFVDTANRLKLFMNWWLALMVYIAGKGVISGGVGGSSFLEDENDFSLLMNMMLPVGLFLAGYDRRPLAKIAFLASSGIAIASVIASFSRGGFVGLIIVVGALWLASARKIVFLLVACVALLIIANLQITHFGTVTAGATYWDEMATIISDEQDYNKDSRKELWAAGWEMFKEHPLGVGPRNFPVWLPEYQTAYFSERSMWGKEAHSLWITLLTELGIPGVLLYLSLLLANLRDVWYLKRQPAIGTDVQRLAHFLSLAYATGLAGYFASGTFLSVLYYPHYWYLSGMIVATRKVLDAATGYASKAQCAESSGSRRT